MNPSAIAMAAMAAMLAMTMQATAQTSNTAPASKTTPTSDAVETLREQDVPRAVRAAMKCDTPAGAMTRRPFAGGFVFAQGCTTKGETLQRIVYATDRDGSNAYLLRFHRPEGRRVSALGNVTFTPGQDEISGDTGRLSRRICHAEGRWQLEGKKPQPALVYWRQTRDCDGKAGWQVMVNRKR
jgi:hypothetical protein